MNIDKAKIRALAEAETKEPKWYHAESFGLSHVKDSGTGAFISACGPATILALLDEIELLERREKMLSEVGCEYCAGSGWVHRIDGECLGPCDSCPCYELICTKHERDQLKAVNFDLEALNQAAKSEVARVKAENEALRSQVSKLQAEPNSYQSGFDAGRAAEKAHADNWRAEVEGLRKGETPLDPVGGDRLPKVGSKVFIHLSREDAWVEHTVAGYYVWGSLGEDPNLHRVFVRVRDANGYLNARLLNDVRTPAAMAKEAGQ